MADKPQQPQAQTGLGQLFVDIGIGGLGKTLKGLNSVAATFLLAKKAATEFVKTAAEPFKKLGKGGVEIQKMSTALATSNKEFQRLALFLKHNSLSESLMGDVDNLETKLYEISQGFSNIPAKMAVAAQQIGINLMDYNGSFESTMKLIDDVDKRTKGMSKQRRNWILQSLGLNKEWGFAFDKGVKATDYTTISDKQVNDAIAQQQAFEKLRIEAEAFRTKFFSIFAPAVTTALTTIAGWVNNLNQHDVPEKVVPKIVGGAVVGNLVGGPMAPIASIAIPVGAMLYENNVNSIGGGNIAPMGGPQFQVKDEDTLPYKFKKWRAKSQGALTGGAADIFPEGAALPPNLSNMTQNVTNNITHDITINGDNANEIADRIAGISAQDIQYTQYQASNLAGL